MLSLRFVDFWKNFKPEKVLSGVFEAFEGEIKISNGNFSDLLLCSVFGDNAKRSYGLHKILLNWEPKNPPACRYSLKLQDFFEDDSIWCPLLLKSTKVLKKEFYDKEPKKPIGFASAIFSNNTGLRLKFLETLLKRCPEKNILIGGANRFSNTNLPKQYDDVQKVQWLCDNRCVFHICPENSFKAGYISEKIRDAYMSHHIPVYWGCLDGVEEYLPSGSFIYIDPNDPDKAIDEMIEVESSPEKQEQMLSKAPIDKLCETTAEEIIIAALRQFINEKFPSAH